jgi:apolipoprotein N-acyltransferase
MPLLGALATGLLLFASDHPLRLWWLQLVAFVPFWLALAAHRRTNAPLAPLGACLGLGYALPLLLVLGTALPIVVAAVASVLEWIAIAMLAGRLLLRGPVLGPLAAAAVVTALEIVIWTVVPLFGTAQSFVRPLSTAPAVVAFVAWTGVGGVVFVTTAAQALVASALRTSRRGPPLLAAAALVAAAAVIDVVRWHRPLGEPVRVATLGWSELNPTKLAEVAAAAKQQGARLLVTPETGLFARDESPEAAAAFGAHARQHGIAVAFGIWHPRPPENRIWFFGDDGVLNAEYAKTHLVPWLESYRAGDGTLAHTTIGGLRVGGMICQDDNFTDLARGYGRSATPLVAVPTNDWPAIRFAHFDNSRFRAIENGYAIARATSNGISAIVSPRGEVVAAIDHTTTAENLLVRDVPVGDGVVTPYARFGDWPMLALSVVLLALGWRRRPAPGDSGEGERAGAVGELLVR